MIDDDLPERNQLTRLERNKLNPWTDPWGKLVPKPREETEAPEHKKKPRGNLMAPAGGNNRFAEHYRSGEISMDLMESGRKQKERIEAEEFEARLAENDRRRKRVVDDGRITGLEQDDGDGLKRWLDFVERREAWATDTLARWYDGEEVDNDFVILALCRVVSGSMLPKNHRTPEESALWTRYSKDYDMIVETFSRERINAVCAKYQHWATPEEREAWFQTDEYKQWKAKQTEKAAILGRMGGIASGQTRRRRGSKRDRKIMAMYRAGETQEAIARKTRIHQSTVCRIIRRETEND